MRTEFEDIYNKIDILEEKNMLLEQELSVIRQMLGVLMSKIV